ncbi:hypothetical protein CFBP6762_01632 [Xanthomonas arboricola pv. fragariae]|nr:hypothetical protein [Xanthomonas arboricola]SOT97614.1 hypothetical protein CFBP6762_01632 [Xanthomonas arboricola pv. fragariae]
MTRGLGIPNSGLANSDAMRDVVVAVANLQSLIPNPARTARAVAIPDSRFPIPARGARA